MDLSHQAGLDKKFKIHIAAASSHLLKLKFVEPVIGTTFHQRNVILSTGGGGAGHAQPPTTMHACPPPADSLRDAVNERAVRILLECILCSLTLVTPMERVRIDVSHYSCQWKKCCRDIQLKIFLAYRQEKCHDKFFPFVVTCSSIHEQHSTPWSMPLICSKLNVTVQISSCSGSSNRVDSYQINNLPAENGN